MANRYNAFITKDKRIFWNKNSTDKPTKEYFNNLMNSIQWEKTGDIAINWLTQFNAQVVLNDNEYTYIKIVDTKKNQTRYYCIDNVEKELNDGYVINISLDIFATYLYTIYDALINYPIFINRTTALTFYNKSIASQLLTDELLPPFNEYVKVKNEYYGSAGGVVWNQQDYFKRELIYDNNTGEYSDATGSPLNNLYIAFKGGTIKARNNFLCDVYINKTNNTTDGNILIIPIMDENVFTFWNKTGQQLINWRLWGEKIADTIKNTKNFINQYLGRFFIPFIWDVIKHAGTNIIYFSGIKNDLNPKALGFIIPLFGQMDGVKEFFDIPATDEINAKSVNLNKYLASKFTQDGNTTPFIYGNIPHVKKSEYTYSFSTTGGMTYFNTNENLNIVWDGIETLPTTTDDYIKYMSSVSSQQNTNLTIAKQSAIFNGVKGAISGTMGGVSSILGGNFGGAITQGVNMVFDATNIGLQYENQKRRIDAQNADKKRTASANVYTSSDINAHKINMTIYKKVDVSSIGDTQSIFLRGIANEYDLNDANKIIWDSGYKISNTIIINDYNQTNNKNISFYDDGVNNFIYWDIDVNNDYIKQIAPTFDNAIIDAIIILLNNPVRFWKKQPDYLETLLMRE